MTWVLEKKYPTYMNIAILAINLQNALGGAGRRRDASLLMHVHGVTCIAR